MCDGRVDVFDSGGGAINTVTIDTDRHAQVSGKVQRAPLQRRLFAPLRAQQHLLMVVGCQKCFCVTFDKSNKTLADAGYGKEVMII